MRELFESYGYYRENLCTVTLKGQDGARKIAAMMEGIRKHIPADIGGLKVTQFRDYKEDILFDYVNGTETITGLPKSDVLYFELEDAAWCCIRPSGTEPKIKFYIGVRGDNEKVTSTKLVSLTKAVEGLVQTEGNCGI